MNLIRTIIDLFSKNDSNETYLPEDEVAVLQLKIDNLIIGQLSCRNGAWTFTYSEEFKQKSEYRPIIGFPELDKEYTSKTLWPFFKIRIPGLKQPAIKELLEKEDIDPHNELDLLKRFGHDTIANPYLLIDESN